ncbi:O-antigen ligase family protein [Desulfothermus naphthae]
MRNIYFIENLDLIVIIPIIILLILLIKIGDIAFIFAVISSLSLIFLFLIFRFNLFFLYTSLGLLGLCPFFFSIDVGSLPAVYLDEVIFIFYAIYFIISYFILKNSELYLGGKWISISIIFLLFIHSISFFTGVLKIVALRNFVETYVWGTILFYIFLNETDNDNINSIICVLATVTIILCIFTILEKITEQNPVLALLNKISYFQHMKGLTGYKYFSPQDVKLAGGVYRPYTIFFHPSEAGTFMAMGISFVVYRFRYSSKILKTLVFGIVSLAILLNFTRGVWVGVAVALFIFYRPARKLALFLVLPSCLLLITLWSIRQHDPFIKRLLDPTNLYARFFYWDVAWNILKNNFWVGIGHMKYQEIYLNYINTLGPNVTINVKQVFVADNVYLTTLVEHGILGLVSLLNLIVVVFYQLKKSYNTFIKIDQKKSYILLACMFSLTVYLAAGLFADVHQFIKVTKLFFIVMGIGFSTIYKNKIL